MIRRARLSFKPNVRPGGRTVGSGARDGGSQPEEPVQAGEATAGPEEKSVGGDAPAERSPDIPETTAATVSENEPSKPAAAPLQRRKRISTLPNIAKPRVSTSAPVAPSQKPLQVESPPSLPVSSVPCKDEVSPPEKAKVPNSPQGSNSAPQGQHVTLPEKRTPIPQVPQFSPFKKASLKHSELSPVKSVEFTQKEEFTPLKERPSQKSSPNECKKSPPKMLVATGNLEKVRLRRAQKLRELLKDEIKKERKEWKSKHPVISNIGELERSKMVMRDFIYFIPESNPMKSSFAETKSSEKAPTESQLSGTPVKNISNDEDDDMDEEEDDSQLLAPRVKVAEDGSIILDEESLTVEVSRGKAPIVEGNDPIFERGSTTTYSSFRKSNYSKPWSEEETDMFYLAISMVGTDFSMIGQLFPHRQRIEIKNKFKREERTNSWRIDKAFKEKKAFDLVFFSKRLERALEAAKKRRTAPKVRQPREKKPTKPRKKPKDKASAEHVGVEEMALLSDGEGADTRTEEKENEGSVSVKESLLPSDNVPGKKRRNRKKKDTKEPEEEPHESSPEDTTKLPKKPRKKKAAGQVKDSELAVNDKNLEDVQEAPDTVREKKKKKKKSRKKKSTDKEVEPEDTEVGDVDVPSPRKDAVDEKSTDFPVDGGGGDDDDDDDSLLCIECGEPSFTQSEILACAEESSLILFTEDGECFSGPDDISSLQESLSVMPGSQTVSDEYGYFDNVLMETMETSQEDSVFETSHLTSDSFKEAPLEDLAEDNHTGTEAEGSTESQKELSRPAALAISRFQRPRPNLPTRALPRQEKVLISESEDITEERNDLPADNSSLQSHLKDKNLESGESEFSITASTRNDDIPCPVETNSSLESPQLQPGDSDIPTKCAAEKEDLKKEKPLPIRGRLVRPKPNLNKAPVKDKTHSPDLRSPPKSDSQDSEEISTVPCTTVLTTLSNNEKNTLTKERAESSTSSQELSTKSTIKPAPFVSGYLQRPKPNTTKTSRKEKNEDMEGPEKSDQVSSEDATGVTGSEAICSPNDAVLKNREEQEEMSTHKDTCLDFATVQDSCIPIKEALSTSLSPVQEIVPEPDPALSSVLESKAESKTSPIKLPQGQLQTLKPNVLESCDHKGISGLRLEDDTDLTPEDTGQDVKGKRDDLSDLGKPTDFRKEASTSDESSGHQENHRKPTEMDQVLQINPKPEVGPKVSEEVQQPAKPTVLTRGRLQRPKPNIVRALPRRGVLTSSDDSRNKSEVESVEKAPESNQPTTSCESEKAPILAKAATEDTPSPVEIVHSRVFSLETIGLPGADQIEDEKSPSVSLDDSASVGMKKEFSGSEDEKKAAPTKPTLTRSRLIRPKPNLGVSVARTSVSVPQKCDVPEEGKSGKHDVNTSSMKNLSQCDAGKKSVLANTDTEDADSPEEITQSYILPLETISLPCVDQMDSEESSAVPMDNSSHVTIKNNVSTSEDERMVEPSPGLTRSRLQRPKPNLGRSVTHPVLSTPQKCDVHKERKTTSDSFDTSSIEKTQKQNVNLSQESCPAESYGLKLGTEEIQGGAVEGSVQIEQSSCTGEQVKEPSVKPLRNRFQKPKPNLGRASVRKESAAFSPEQKEVGFDSSSKRPEHLADKEGSSSVSTNNDASGNSVQSTQHTTIKPALLRRGRLVRPVPSYGKPSNKRLSVLQSKTVDEEETSTDTDLETLSNKRKASECFPDVSPKRSCIPDTSQNSSDSALDQVPSTCALPDSSQSNDPLEDNKQHSRFGRLLKRPVSTTPPVLTKPSENVTERPEKKTSRNNKSVKSTVAKPMSSKGKTTLVKIRAMKEDDDEDDELEYEDEDYDVSPDKLSQAPVFVPFSLRSPKPIPAEIEETLEEFEIPVEDLGFPIGTAQNLRSPCPTLQDVPQHVPASQADPGNKGHCDGSTEAAMTLISIGNSAFQSKLGEPLDSDEITGSQLSHNADCKPEASTLSVKMTCATEKDTTINARPVKVCQDTLGLQVGSEALSVSANEHRSDPVISDLHTSEQPSHLLNVNVTLPLEQMSDPIVQDDVQQQDCSTSDHLLEEGAGEETFILTLVEIPISEGYSYSCDGNSYSCDGSSVDVLPAPVLITSGSSQMVTPDHRAAAVSEPSSSVSCPSGQEEAKLEQNPPSRKRGASISSESDKSQPCIKALRTSAEQGEDHTTNTSAVEENGTSSRLAEMKTEETELPHQSSMDIAVSSPEGEKVPECTIDSTRFDTVAHIENLASTSYDSPSSVLPSSSSRIQQRPGRKPLGFLPLVCKGKPSQKTKVTSKKTSLKPKSKKAKVHENSLSNEVFCQSSSSAVTSTPANTETIPCTSQISEDPDTISQESPKSQELATEEDAATVSEYFFSDIFMEVDE
ncbi:transcription factor TFIIIB component B'' homolog isoform X2 [Rana temporaria]|uniref:transcription factor TFIIIB component B'' homolog isoform X2 n=1 Tax=Rana temporaria TaxID=8407 RepID=UPI001AACC581|nr:transcription factor TFIIIB component B'' homolog isoform X2 [Rana temporaria]